MCLSTVYKNEVNDANMLAKNVADIKVDGGKLIFTDLMGIRYTFDGTLENHMPLLACSVAGAAISFDLASRGTALTLRLRDSFRPLTCGLSPASLAASTQRSHQHMIKSL